MSNSQNGLRRGPRPALNDDLPTMEGRVSMPSQGDWNDEAVIITAQGKRHIVNHEVMGYASGGAWFESWVKGEIDKPVVVVLDDNDMDDLDADAIMDALASKYGGFSSPSPYDLIETLDSALPPAMKAINSNQIAEAYIGYRPDSPSAKKMRERVLNRQANSYGS